MVPGAYPGTSTEPPVGRCREEEREGRRERGKDGERVESSALWWSSPGNARRPRCQALFSGSINGNMGPMFPRSLGTTVMMTPAPGSRVTYPQPTQLLRDHMWSLPSGAQLYPRKGPPLLSCPRTHRSCCNHHVPDPGHQHTLPFHWPLGQAQVGSYEVQSFVPLCSRGNSRETNRLIH